MLRNFCVNFALREIFVLEKFFLHKYEKCYTVTHDLIADDCCYFGATTLTQIANCDLIFL